MMKKKLGGIFLSLLFVLLYRTLVLCQTDSFDSGLSLCNNRSSVIFMGDPQRTGFGERLLLREQNDAAQQAVMNAVAEEIPAFAVILGDLVSAGGKKNAWNYFDSCTLPLRRNHIPIIAIPGNHDYFGGKKKAMRNFSSHFPLLEGRTWTSACFKSVAFILLNSNFKEMTPAALDSQNSWYTRKLDDFQMDSSIAVIIVGCHHSPFTNSAIVSENKDVQTRFVPAFIHTPKAKLFISGHCHSYERFNEYGKIFVVSGGAGGPRQNLITNQTKRRLDLFAGPSIRPFHYCKISLGKDQLHVQMIQLDDSLKLWSLGEEFIIPLHEKIPK
jgi:Icc-related predicted phosphoesterase